MSRWVDVSSIFAIDFTNGGCRFLTQVETLRLVRQRRASDDLES